MGISSGLGGYTPPGLVLVKSQTVGSAVSSVTVSNAFSANWDNYRITYTGGTMTAQQRFNLSLGSSTTGYYEFLIYGNYSGSTISGANTSNGSSWVFIGGGNTSSVSCIVELQDPYLATHTKMQSGGTLQTAQALWDNGIHAVSSSYSDFTLATQGGATVSGGVIRVYGYRN